MRGLCLGRARGRDCLRGRWSRRFHKAFEEKGEKKVLGEGLI